MCKYSLAAAVPGMLGSSVLTLMQNHGVACAWVGRTLARLEAAWPTDLTALDAAALAQLTEPRSAYGWGKLWFKPANGLRLNV